MSSFIQIKNGARLCLFLITLTLVFSSCYKSIYKNLQNSIDFKSVAYLKGDADGTFPGLKEIVDHPSSKLTEIVLIHGVKSHGGDHFRDIIWDLIGRLDYDYVDQKILSSNDKDNRHTATRYIYANQMQDTIHVYAITWSPITDEVKEEVYSKLDTILGRTRLSKIVKQEFLIDVFADLALYSGDYREAMLKPMEVTLKEMMRNKSSKKVFITASFGSKMALDALINAKKTKLVTEDILEYTKQLIEQDDLSENQSKLNSFLYSQNSLYQRAADSLSYANIDVNYVNKTINNIIKDLSQTSNPKSLSDKFEKERQEQLNYISEIDQLLSTIKCFYMISNQLPFTNLMDLDAKISPDQFIGDIFQDIEILSSSTPNKIKFVSFYDPDDIFGYRLPTKGYEYLNIVNVELRNTCPLYFNPEALRTKYLSSPNINKELQQIIQKTLDQGVEEQSLVIGIDGPSKSALGNPSIRNHLLFGDQFSIGTKDTATITTKYITKKAKKIKTKAVPFRKSNEKNGSVNIKYQKWGGGRKFGEKIILSPFRRNLKKLDKKKAYLDNELPASHLDFEGMQATLEQSDTLHILTMHGMVTKQPDHFDDLVDEISHRLNFNSPPSRVQTRFIRLPAHIKMAEPPQVKIMEFHKGELIPDGGTSRYNEKMLRFYIVSWSPINQLAKEELRKIDTLNQMTQKRSALPAEIKDILINDGFCDVVLSLNSYRPLLAHCLKNAFSAITAKNPYLFNDPVLPDSTANAKNIFFISGSLGSTLLFDYFSSCLITDPTFTEDNQHITDKERATATRIAKRLRTFFMLSNQLPLASLRSLKPSSFTTSTNEDSFDWERHIYHNLKDYLEDTLQIISFNDPNDILGFQLLETDGPSKLQVTNVPINLAGGIEVDLNQLLKLSKKIDKVLKHAIPKKKQLLNTATTSITIKDAKKLREDLLKNLKLNITESIIPFLDPQEPRQTFVFDILKAHEGGKQDDRVLEMMTLGTENIKKRKKETE